MAKASAIRAQLRASSGLTCTHLSQLRVECVHSAAGNVVLTACQKLWHAVEACTLHDADEAVRLLILQFISQGKAQRGAKTISVDCRWFMTGGALCNTVKLMVSANTRRDTKAFCNASLLPWCRKASATATSFIAWSLSDCRQSMAYCTYLQVGWDLLKRLDVDASQFSKNIVAHLQKVLQSQLQHTSAPP